jgi:hypothetical protein
LNLTVNKVKRTDVDAVICSGEQVLAGGEIFTTSVTNRVIVLTSASGCDSIVTVNVVVLNNDTTVTNRTICLGDFVNIGGQTYTTSGTYYIPFVNGQCSGTVQLNLTTNGPSSSKVTETICSGETAVVGGQAFTQSGVYEVLTTNSLGCDSTITLNLTVIPAATTIIDSTVCQGITVQVGNNVFNTTGTYRVGLTSASGCDSSVILRLVVLNNDTTTTNQTICSGERVTIGGQEFNQSGTYYVTTTTGNCSGTVKLNLTVRALSSTTLDRFICAGESVTVGGQTFNATGRYTVVLQNSVGCDSTITLNLNVSEGGSKSQLDTTICKGGIVTYGGQTFTSTGVYQIVYPSGVCRDTLLLNLVVNDVVRSSISREICEGSSVTVGNTSYTATGIYTITLTSAGGCDSIVTLNLTVNKVKRTDVDAVICSGEQVLAGGEIFTTSVTNRVIVLTSASGCDSIVTVNVVVLNNDTTVTNRTICLGDFVNIGGQTYTTSGTYYIPFVNGQCSGTVQLNLTTNGPSSSKVTETICSGETAVVGGQAFTQSGVYEVLTTNSLGCDSTITLNLTVIPAATTIIDSTVCQGITVQVGNNVFNTTGTYRVGLTSASGCDSSVILRLVVLNNDTTTTNQTICSGERVTIGGQEFNQSGTYYVTTTTGNCSGTVKLNLTVRALSSTTLDRFICAGESVTVGGQTFNATGRYTVVLQNSVGCDSTITLNLNVSEGGSKSQLDTTICKGGIVTYGGQTFTSTGVYQIVYPSGVCRDTLLLNLVVNDVVRSSISREICEGSSVTVGNTSYTATGIYTITLTSAGGCDSIVTLNLTVNKVKRTDVDAVICSGEQVLAGGEIFTTSVTNRVIVLTSASGCDSIVTVNVVVLNNDTTVTNRTICLGDFVNIGGQTYTTSGTYYIPFVNGQCSGTVQLNLTTNGPSSSKVTETICSGETAVVGGQAFTQSGVYEVLTTNSLGCDSTITLNLTVIPAATTIIDSTVCQGITVQVGNNVFNTTGTYRVGLTSASGCDSSVILRLVVLNNDTTTTNQTICSGERVTIGGQEFNQSGTYYVTTTTGNCSGTVKLNLTVRALSSTTLDRFICAGESVTVGGQTFNATGRYTVVLQNSVGCDSTITLNLNVSEGGSKSQLDTTICKGGIVTYGGQTFTSTGVYQIVYPSGVCRDTLLLNLVVNDVVRSSISREICEGSSVTVGNTSYTATGIYTITLTSAGGCDSIVTLNLTVNKVKRTDVDAVICSGEQVLAGGEIFTTSVTNRVIVLTSASGCDSIVTVNVVVLNNDTTVTNRTICLGDFVNIGGQTYTTSGTYYIPFVNGQCSGTVQLNLTTNGPSSSKVTETICSGETAVVGGQAFTQSGVYEVLTTNSLGCDSTITLNLTVIPAATTIIDSTVCQGITVQVGNNVFNTTGTYRVGLTSASGCDSSVILRLVVLNNDTTTTNQTICSGERVTIGGQEFNQSGTYYVTTTTGNCSGTVKLNLTVRALSSTTLDRFICAGESVTVGGQTFNATGRYTVVLQNSVGCDSTITLNLNVSEGGSKSQLDTTICKGGIVTYGGQTFTSTGVYQIVYPSGVCRDTLLLNLVVNDVVRSSISREICEGSSVTVGNTSYTATGIYTITLTSAGGCDSIVTLNLTVNKVKRTDVDAVICSGEQVLAGGEIFTTSVTNRVIVLTSASGCDSIVTVNVVVLNNDTTVTNRTICLGDFVNIGGQTYTTSGTYYIPFVNGQCSGTVQLNLTTNGPSSSKVTETICSGETAVVGGQAFTQSGVYEVLTTNSLGCDSTITLNLTVIPAATTIIDSTVCQGITVQVGNNVFNTTGTYRVGLTSASGCDSSVILRLVVLNNDTTTTNQTICSGERVTIGGQEFNQSGTYYVTTTTGNCSGTVKLNLTVRAVSSTTLDRFICAGESVTVGGQTFNATGRYTVVLQNSVGCDSTITLNLNVSEGGSKTQLDTSDMLW